MALDRAMIVWSVRAEANRGRSTAVILSVTWCLTLLSSCEQLLRTSYSELKPLVTTTLTYTATTLYAYHTDPPRKYCRSDYDQMYRGNKEVANLVTLFVALIPVLMIVGTAIAICIKTRRRHSNGQQTAQRRKVGNIPSLWREDPKLWCVCRLQYLVWEKTLPDPFLWNLVGTVEQTHKPLFTTCLTWD